MQASDKARSRSDAAPAIEVPAGAEVFDFRTERNVEDHFGDAAIELLGKFQERELAEFLAIGRAPDGDVEGFLFELFGDGEDAEEGAGDGLGDFDSVADGVGIERGVGGDEREFEGHGVIPFPERVEFSTERKPEGSVETPWRNFRPVAEDFRGPRRRFIRVTRIAGVGDFVFIGGGRRDEGKGVGANVYAGDLDFDFGHVAIDAVAAWGAGFVMGVGFESAGVRAVE